MTFFGAYPTRKKLRFRLIRQITSFSVTLLQISTMVMLVYYGDLQTKLGSAIFLITQIGFLGKLSGFMLNSESILEIEEFLLNPSFHEFTKKYTKTIEENLKPTKRLGTFLRNLISMYILMCLILPIVQNKKRVPMAGWFPYDVFEDKYYYPTFIVLIYALIVSGWNNSGIDIIFIHVTDIACVQLDLLMRNLQELDYTNDTNIIEIKLKKYVCHHIDIITYTKLIEDIYKSVTFVQCLVNVLTICCVGVQLIVMLPIKSLEFVWQVIFLAIMIYQVFFYCWFGNKIVLKSADLSLAAYMSNWYESNISIRKTLFIFMERSKQPMTLNAGGFFYLSLKAFMTIIRTSYSYMAVLQRMYK